MRIHGLLGSTFVGWSGACSGTDAACAVTMDQARSVTASFKRVYQVFVPMLTR